MKLVLCLAFVLVGCDDRLTPEAEALVLDVDAGVSDGSPNDLEKREKLPNNTR